MAGVLTGFAIIAFVIGVGYLIGRFNLLGPDAGRILGRTAFFVLLPALLFTVLAEADLTHLFSAILPISAIAAVINIVLYLLVSLLIWRRSIPDATVGAMAASYANANNIGLPVSIYVLGDASSSAPVILFQLIFLAPLALTVLDISTRGRLSLKNVLLQPIRNPLIIGSLLGLIVALLHLKLPAPVLAPFQLIGGAAVPVVLLSFGMSLHGSRVLEPGTQRKDVIVASALKLVLLPVSAWLLGHFVWHLPAHQLFVVVVLAALPTAQNVFNYAQRYSTGMTLARDTVLITTVLSIVVLVIVAALLAPG
jgi:malonate transporter